MEFTLKSFASSAVDIAGGVGITGMTAERVLHVVGNALETAGHFTPRLDATTRLVGRAQPYLAIATLPLLIRQQVDAVEYIQKHGIRNSVEADITLVGGVYACLNMGLVTFFPQYKMAFLIAGLAIDGAGLAYSCYSGASKTDLLVQAAIIGLFNTAPTNKGLWDTLGLKQVFRDLEEDCAQQHMSHFRAIGTFKTNTGTISQWKHAKTGISVYEKPISPERAVNLEKLLTEIKEGKISPRNIIPIFLAPDRARYFEYYLEPTTHRNTFEYFLKSQTHSYDLGFLTRNIRKMRKVTEEMRLRGYDHGHPHSANWIVNTDPIRLDSDLYLIDWKLSTKGEIGPNIAGYDFGRRIINGLAPTKKIRFETCDFSEAHITNWDIKAGTFNLNLFLRSRIVDSVFEDIFFNRSVFAHCYFDNVRWTRCDWRRALFPRTCKFKNNVFDEVVCARGNEFSPQAIRVLAEQGCLFTSTEKEGVRSWLATSNALLNNNEYNGNLYQPLDMAADLIGLMAA